MPRLFVGLEIPPDIAFALSLKRGGLAGARWIDPEKFHITLRFIGDVHDRLAYDVVDCLAQLDHPPFTLSLGNLDMFAARGPHSLWASVSPSQPLFHLKGDVERSLRRLGLDADSRKFTPHVSLARLKGISYELAARYLTERGDFQSLPFEVNSFVLMSSRRGIGGGPYVIEERFELYDYEFADDADYESDLSFSTSL